MNLLGKESAAVARSGRAAPNPCEPDRKACRYGHRPWTIKRFFALIGRGNWSSTSSAFRGEFDSRSGESNPRPSPRPKAHPFAPIRAGCPWR